MVNISMFPDFGSSVPCDKRLRVAAATVFLHWAYNPVFSCSSAVVVAALTNLGFSTISQLSITDALWRAVDFHRSGRRGLSQKTAFIRRGLAEDKFSNYYPYILDSSISDGQRATLRPNVIWDLETAWEVSSSSAEEAGEEPENLEPETVAPKATWGGSSSGPKEPPFPPPPSRLRPAEPSLVPKEPSYPPTGRSHHQEGSSSSSATVARAKPADPSGVVLGRLQSVVQQQIFREQSSRLHFLQMVQHTVQQFWGHNRQSLRRLSLRNRCNTSPTEDSLARHVPLLYLR